MPKCPVFLPSLVRWTNSNNVSRKSSSKNTSVEMIKVGDSSRFFSIPFLEVLSKILRKLTWPTWNCFVRKSRIFPRPLKHTIQICTYKYKCKRGFFIYVTLAQPNCPQNSQSPSHLSTWMFVEERRDFCWLEAGQEQSCSAPEMMHSDVDIFK